MGSFSIVTGNGFTGDAQRCVRSGPYRPEPNSQWGLEEGDGFVQYVTGQTSYPYDLISWTLSFKYRASDTWGVGLDQEPGAQISFAANTGNAITGSYIFSVGALDWNYNGTYWFCRISFTWFGHLGGTGSWIEIDEVSLSSGSGVSGASGTSGSSGSSGNSGGSGSSGTSGSSGVSGGSGSSGSSGSSGVSGGSGSSGSSGSSGTSGAVGRPGSSGSSGTSGAGAYESDNYRLQYYDSSVPNNRGSSPGLNYLAKKDLVVNSGVSINQTNWAYGDTALYINQTDLNQPFFRFRGTFDNYAPISANLSKYQGYTGAGGNIDHLWDAYAESDYGWSIQGMLKMRVGEGGDSDEYWLPFYTWYQNEKPK